LTSIILPFTTAATNPPTIPEDVLDLLKASQPQVLVLSAGLALQDIEPIKSLKAVVVIDVTAGPHMDWHEDRDSIPVKTWVEVLESTVHHEPSAKLASVAIESFSKTTKGFKSVEFTHQVHCQETESHSRISLLRSQAKSNYSRKITPCPRRIPFFRCRRSRIPHP
jgi:hypothetical protein